MCQIQINVLLTNDILESCSFTITICITSVVLRTPTCGGLEIQTDQTSSSDVHLEQGREKTKVKNFEFGIIS